MDDWADIQTGDLGIIVAGFQICQHCGIVDRDRERTRIGYPCPVCGLPSPVGQTYFSDTVLELIDLTHEIHTLTAEPPAESRLRDSHRAAAIIFFCTLGEVLLTHFLREIMCAMGKSAEVIQQALRDTMYARDRCNSLFPELVDASWRDALQAISADAEFDFVETFEFYLERTKQRNLVVHEGHVWSAGPETVHACLDHVWPLVSMFVALHNKYVVRELKRRGSKH